MAGTVSNGTFYMCSIEASLSVDNTRTAVQSPETTTSEESFNNESLFIIFFCFINVLP